MMLGLPINSIEDLVTRKKRGYFRIENLAGRTVITVHRPGQDAEVFFCVSPGHANQVRQPLTDEGLCGLIEDLR